MNIGKHLIAVCVALAVFLNSVFICAADSPLPGNLEVIPYFGASSLAPGNIVDLDILVTLKAPEEKKSGKRQPVAVSLVMDRSSSMNEEKKMDYAKQAGKALVNSLEPNDKFALVVYDSVVNVLYPMGQVKDKKKLLQMIDAIQPDGYTFLSGGLEKGIQQLAGASDMPSRVIIVSDGLANHGVTNGEQVAAIGAKARKGGIGVSSIGLGRDFDEDLMQLLAQRGGGQYYYIADSEYLPTVFKEELNLVVNSYTRDLNVFFNPSDGVNNVRVYGYTTARDGDSTRIETSDLRSGEERQIMLSLNVNVMERPGSQPIGDFSFEYRDPDDGKAYEVLVPLILDVVTDPDEKFRLDILRADSVRLVQDELLLRRADEEHLLAMEELQAGNVGSARKRLRRQQAALAVAALSNKAVESKLQRIRLDEASLDQASKDANIVNAMVKANKSAAYHSYQGVKSGNMLSVGDSGFMVEKMQKALIREGFYKGKADGVFSKSVAESVKKFQAARALPADGVVGPSTMYALGLDGSGLEMDPTLLASLYMVDPERTAALKKKAEEEAQLRLIAEAEKAMEKAHEEVSPAGGPAVTILRSGDSGGLVKNVQAEMLKRGLYKGKADGVYTSEFAEAVRNYQVAMSLLPDGIVGPATLAALGMEDPLAAQSASETAKLNLLRSGDSGASVRTVQAALIRQGFYKGAADGVFSAEFDAAVRSFQTAKYLAPDGIVGPLTMRALGMDDSLLAAKPVHNPNWVRSGDSGPKVKSVQSALIQHGFYKGAADGVFSAEFDAAVRSFQAARSLSPDGVVGPLTMQALGLEAPAPDTAMLAGLGQGVQKGNMLRNGDTGDVVKSVQSALKKQGFYSGESNGVFNPATEEAVRKFQAAKELSPDGVVGPATMLALGMDMPAMGGPSESEERRSLRNGDSGERVQKIQSALARHGYYSGTVDGRFSPALEDAVRSFQVSRFLEADGVVGPMTLKELGVR